MLPKTIVFVIVTAVLLQTACTAPPITEKDTTELQGKYKENPFLRRISTTTHEVSEIETEKIISLPGSKRSFIMLDMPRTNPDAETMQTVLIVLTAFEQRFNVTIPPGGWRLIWSPDDERANTPFIHGICVDHDQPIDLENPNRIRLDEVVETARATGLTAEHIAKP